MARYQIYSPNPVWFDLAGVAATPGGKIQFYEIGTTNPKATYNAFSAGSANSNPVLMDTSGRLNTEVWLDGDYSIAVLDEDDTVVDTFDLRSPTDNAAVVPVPGDGQFLGGDATDFILKTYRGMPDPTGLGGYVPVSDGETYIMQPLPEDPVIPNPEIVITTTPNESFRAGISTSTTKFLMQFGTGSAPASGNQNTTVGVVYPTPFNSLFHVGVTQTHNGVTSNGTIPVHSNTAESESGFTARFSTNDNSPDSAWNIINSVPFTWVAYGTVVVEP